MNIIAQWLYYIEWIHYKIMLKKKVELVRNQAALKTKEVFNLKQDIKAIEDQKKQFAGILKHISDPNKNKQIYLVAKELKLSFWDKVKNAIPLFFKFEGYLLLGHKGNYELFKIKNLRNLYNLKNRESYNIHEKVGYFHAKPLFLADSRYAITLNINDEGKLYYDPEAYYNYINIMTKGNITRANGNPFNLMQFIQNNLILVIILIVMAFLLFTPEGKQMLANFINGQK